MDPSHLLRLAIRDRSYLFIDDLNRNAMNVISEIVIVIMKKSRDIVDDESDEILTFKIYEFSIPSLRY